MLLSAEQLSKTYATRVILNGVSLYVNQNDKVGVIGVNGTGKSTLLRILADVEAPDGGRVLRDPNVRLEYLPQAPIFQGERTVLEQVFAGLSSQARELQDYEAKAILTKLGITNFTQRVETLSGGQRKRCALASVLVHPCDVLILDEPTNHLDTEMVLWLEDYLRMYKGALLMVTHDRYFLERVVNRMVEVEAGNLYSYEGGYDSYLKRKAERMEMSAASERKRQALLRKEYQWVTQGPTARGTKSRERLERYEALKQQSGLEEKNELELSARFSRMGKKTIELTDVTKGFDGKVIVKDVSCILLRSDRIGIVGTNGSGKSTLLNLIAGNLHPDFGTVTVGETVRVGYFSQDNPPMDTNLRVIEYVKQIGNSIETPEGTLTATQLLDQFLFTNEMQWSQIGKLSGGEKRRLFLLSVLAEAPNVLLLDEPTNDLDLQTLTILEAYLETFPGAVIAVSHDRYFLDKVAHRIFAVEEDGQVKAYPGGYSEFLDQRKADKQPAASERATPVPAKPSGPKKLKFSYMEQREFETIDAEIAALERELAEIRSAQEEMGSDYLALQQLQEKEASLEETLDAKMERWMYLQDLSQRIETQ